MPCTGAYTTMHCGMWYRATSSVLPYAMGCSTAHNIPRRICCHKTVCKVNFHCAPFSHPSSIGVIQKPIWNLQHILSNETSLDLIRQFDLKLNIRVQKVTFSFKTCTLSAQFSCLVPLDHFRPWIKSKRIIYT